LPRRSVKPRTEPPQVKRLKTRVRNLQSKLAESIPKAELESLKATLEARVTDLEAKLARSIPEKKPMLCRPGLSS